MPGQAEEAARDLVRTREDIREEPMRARHRVIKLLLRRGTGIHHTWLCAQRFSNRALQVAYDSARVGLPPSHHGLLRQADACRVVAPIEVAAANLPPRSKVWSVATSVWHWACLPWLDLSLRM